MSMSSQPDIRTQLRSLSIPRDQRPAAPALRKSAIGRIVVWMVGLAVIVAVGTAVFRYLPAAGDVLPGASAQEPIRTVTVTERSSSEPMAVHTATGKIVSDHTVKVATKVSGQIIELFFEQGDRVKEGQILAKIENVLPLARRDEAAANLEKSRAALEFQRVNFERVQRLHEQSNAPDIEYQDARRAFEEADADVKKNEALLAWSEKILRDCSVMAPIAGVILERNVEVGDFVAAEGGLGANANSQFGTIADMTTLRVEVDVSELDIYRIKKDMKCQITPDAYKDKRYDGHVMWIDPGANYSKATVQVKVRIDNPDEFLRVEGVAQVVFLAGGAENSGEESGSADSSGGIWIQSAACLPGSDGHTAMVFVVEDGKLREKTIKLGRRVNDQIQVTSGLSPGQTIAVGGLDKLTDGQKIKR